MRGDVFVAAVHLRLFASFCRSFVVILLLCVHVLCVCSHLAFCFSLWSLCVSFYYLHRRSNFVVISPWWFCVSVCVSFVSWWSIFLCLFCEMQNDHKDIWNCPRDKNTMSLSFSQGVFLLCRVVECVWGGGLRRDRVSQNPSIVVIGSTRKRRTWKGSNCYVMYSPWITDPPPPYTHTPESRGVPFSVYSIDTSVVLFKWN